MHHDRFCGSIPSNLEQGGPNWKHCCLFVVWPDVKVICSKQPFTFSPEVQDEDEGGGEPVFLGCLRFAVITPNEVKHGAKATVCFLCRGRREQRLCTYFFPDGVCVASAVSSERPRTHQETWDDPDF